MKNLLLASVFLAGMAASFAPAFAQDVVPCEDMLQTVKDTVAAATKLSDADKAKVVELQQKGLDRCKADDDANADKLFGEAMKLLGK